MVQKDVLDISSLRNALSSLESAMAVIANRDWLDTQAPPLRNTLIAGVIQNFEFVYEISIKMIRRTIELEAASPTEVDETNFRDLLRTAAEKGLIGDVNAWFSYRAMRNITSHTYDQEKAQKVIEGLEQFTGDAKQLVAQLTKRYG